MMWLTHAHTHTHTLASLRFSLTLFGSFSLWFFLSLTLFLSITYFMFVCLAFVFGTSKNVYTLLSQSPVDALDWQEKISDRISHQKKLLVKYISRFDIPDNISEGRIMRARLDYRGSADAGMHPFTVCHKSSSC